MHFWSNADGEICKRETAKRRDVKGQVCRHLCCDVPMSRFCRHSHRSARSEKADGRLKPSPRWTWKKKKKKTLQKRLAKWPRPFFYIPCCIWSRVRILIFLFLPILWINAEEKPRLCRNGSSSLSHFMFWSDIFCIHLSLCVVQLYPDKNKCLPYKVLFVSMWLLCHLCTQDVTEQINCDRCMSKVFYLNI